MKFAAEQLMGLVVSPSNDDQTVEMLPAGVKPQPLTTVHSHALAASGFYKHVTFDPMLSLSRLMEILLK